MGYIPNPLNVFDTYTYNLSISMIRPSDSASYEQNKSRGTAIPIMNNVSNSRYNISSLEFISRTGFHPGRNQLQGMFNLTVYEQNGVTLLSKIKESAAALGIPNHTQAHYILEITFNGRDPNGSARTYQDVFTYALLFTKFTFKVDEGGTVYQIEAYESTSAGYQYINNVIQETTTIEATTVGEFVQEFSRVYNLAQQREVEMNPNVVYPDEYNFEFVDAAQDWLQWEFEELSNPIESTSINIVDGNRLQIMLHNGSQLTDVIHNVLSLTREYKQIPMSSGGFYRDAGPDQPSTATLDSFPTFFKAIPEIKYGPYDPLRQDFSKVITFNIKPHITADLIVDAESYYRGITDPSVQSSRVQSLIGEGLMQKRYDYLYTGTNTEVLGLDLKFDMIYYQTTALANGQQGDPNIVSPRAGQDGSATISRIRTIATELSSLRQDEITLPGQLDRVQQETTRLSDSITGFAGDTGLTRTLDQLVGQGQELATQLSNIPNQINQLQQELTAELSLFEQESSGRIEGIAYPVRFEADVINGADHGGGESNLDGGTFQFGAVRSSLENPADLLRIELTIRGDPYWLGKPKTVASTSGLQAYDYTLGGSHIFVYANLPVADENSAGLRPPRPDYQVTAVYRVLNIISRFQDGQFVQYLDAAIDAATNAPIAIDALQSGRGGSANSGGPAGIFSGLGNGARSTGSQNYSPTGVPVDPAGAQEAAANSLPSQAQ